MAFMKRGSETVSGKPVAGAWGFLARLGRAIGLAAVVLGVAAPLARAGSASVDKGAPDWNGIWVRVGSLNFDPTLSGDAADKPPLTAEFQAIYDRGLRSMAAGAPVNDPTANCLPPGFPRTMNMAYPMEIFQRSGQVAIFAEYQGQIRRIYTDGRKYDPNADRTYNGYSVGRWDRGDLIVETRGLRDDTYINMYGLKLSGELVVHERFHQVDQKTLTDTLTMVDPKALTRPWTVVKTYRRAPPGTEIMEYVCSENNRNPTLPDGSTGVVLNKSLSQ